MLGLSSNATIMVPPAIHCTRPETRTGISCAALTATRSVPVRAQAVSSARSALLARRFIRILLIRLPIRHLSSRSDHERSEEHTSELQSRLHLVCRLLLEKKKKKLQSTKDI